MSARSAPRARRVTRALLRTIPLPSLSAHADKEARGRVLVVGGSTLVPGAILLAGLATLRAGAGKLQLATVAPVARGLALEVPEALVLPLPESGSEIAAARAFAPLAKYVADADAALVGPGMLVRAGTRRLLTAIARRLPDDATLILDGAAAIALGDDESLLAPLDGRAVLTPHAGEMAALLGIEKDAITADPRGVALSAAERFGATVTLKGAESWIASPDGRLLRYDGGSVGLGTSGSGDTLAGIIAGLAARGADAFTAAAWGVWAHGEAGNRLSRRMGRVGFLARELLAELPALVGR